MKWTLALALEANFIALPWLGSESHLNLIPPLPHHLPDGDGSLPFLSWLKGHCVRLEYKLILIMEIPLNRFVDSSARSAGICPDGVHVPGHHCVRLILVEPRAYVRVVR